MWEKYFDNISELITEVKKSQADQIGKAADFIVDSILADGIIHTFGTGHSALVAQEIFMRAGGLVPVNAMLDSSFLPSSGALRSTEFERTPGTATAALGNYDVRSHDVSIVISNSGRNAAPVEMALAIKRKGLKVIAVTSLKHSKSIVSGHESGRKLYEIADVVLDNLASPGDASLDVPGVSMPMGAVSGIMGSLLVQALTIEAAIRLADMGKPPAVFASVNMANANMEELLQAVEKYKGRIKHI